ncbi:LOW QUALITY PROTEIN: hypothetical protein TorRG33x02_018530 [Trema orientale]|uniref:Uncharacterized protein n=1 Tax=Trema orientale TaxID=63057 RepID=A0A2P5FWB2_TREOI|nr:LOW QUALITY PROTEIN: hypothetical protein TorRG33x02_018530 [Trema orientale]
MESPKKRGKSTNVHTVCTERILPNSKFPQLKNFQSFVVSVAENWFTWNRYALDNPTDRPRHSREANACAPLRPVQPLCIREPLQRLHHQSLKNDGYGDYPQEQFVPVNPFKHVLLL